MANYFDNQSKWSWEISKDSVLVTTDHGTHTHTLDVTNVPIGEMADNTGSVMGDAHRAASHDFKETNEASAVSVENETDPGTAASPNDAVNEGVTQDSGVEEDGLDGGEDCDDGLDI